MTARPPMTSSRFCSKTLTGRFRMVLPSGRDAASMFQRVSAAWSKWKAVAPSVRTAMVSASAPARIAAAISPAAVPCV